MKPLNLRIEEKFVVKAPLEVVWIFLRDPAFLSGCLPGIEQTKQVNEKTHSGLMNVKIAQIGAQFSITVAILEEQPPTFLTSKLQGLDSRNESSVELMNSLFLSSISDKETEVSYKSEGTLSGKLVALGGGMMTKLKAIQMGKQFASEVVKRVEERQKKIKSLLEKHYAFWKMTDVQKPLMSLGRHHPLQPRKPIRLTNGEFIKEGDEISPPLIDVQWLVDQQGRPSSAFSGDFIHGVAPYDLCWTEAILGCHIRWSQGYVWSEPFIDDWDELDNLCLQPDNPWLAKLLEITRLQVERAQGRYPVCQPLMRGPIDMATAALGDERSLWAMVDDKENFRCLLDICTDIFIEIAKMWQAVSPPFLGGGHCEYGIWAPGTMIRTQADNASLTSPQLYAELLSPCDKKIIDAFDYPLIHTHSGWLPIGIEELLKQEKLAAIQVSLDYPAGPSFQTLLSLFREVNKQKPLIVSGPLTQKELDVLLETLSPNGLCLQVALRDEE